jgi:hypothetical protein
MMMRYFRWIPRSGWMLGGLIAGLALAPGAAVAASFTLLHGANGPAVNATNGSQLLTAEAPPSSWTSIFGWNGTPGSCSNLPSASARQGFVIRQADVDFLPSGSGSGSTPSIVWLFDGAGCQTSQLVGEVNMSGSSVIPFTPGIALPRNGVMSIRYNGTALEVRVYALGYTVPASDAPASTRVLVCSSSCP